MVSLVNDILTVREQNLGCVCVLYKLCNAHIAHIIEELYKNMFYNFIRKNALYRRKYNKLKYREANISAATAAATSNLIINYVYRIGTYLTYYIEKCCLACVWLLRICI